MTLKSLTTSTVGFIATAGLLVFCRREISELLWPIAVKLCYVLGSALFYNISPKIGEGFFSPKIWTKNV